MPSRNFEQFSIPSPQSSRFLLPRPQYCHKIVDPQSRDVIYRRPLNQMKVSEKVNMHQTLTSGLPRISSTVNALLPTDLHQSTQQLVSLLVGISVASSMVTFKFRNFLFSLCYIELTVTAYVSVQGHSNNTLHSWEGVGQSVT